jgi:predicted transcriptional regulator
MTTTSIKLSDELKSRVTQAAQALGTSPHAFMVAAIEQATDTTERHERLVAESQAAHAAIQKTGTGFDAGQVHAYFEAKLAGRPIAFPKALQWRK